MSGRKRGMESTTGTSRWTMAAKPPGHGAAVTGTQCWWLSLPRRDGLVLL